jgi:predicted nucleic acid-binding protein
MPFVLDASVTLSWAFPDEQSSAAARAADLLERSVDSALVPSIWWYEVRNILVVNERRGRITPARSAAFLKEIDNLDIVIDSPQSDLLVLDLSRQNRLSVYDAAYLALAVREGLPLATFDKALQAAAQAVGIQLLA